MLAKERTKFESCKVRWIIGLHRGESRKVIGIKREFSSSKAKLRNLGYRSCNHYFILCIGYIQWNVWNWMHPLWILSFSCFLEIFQKSPGGHSKPLGDLCYFVVFVSSRDGTAWRHYSTHQATLGDLPSFMGFWLNCLAVTINHQATWTFPSFLVF